METLLLGRQTLHTNSPWIAILGAIVLFQILMMTLVLQSVNML